MEDKNDKPGMLKVMGSRLLEASARAFGMVVFVIAYLLLSHFAWPKNWFALMLVYLVCIPIVLAYEWLSDEAPSNGSRRRGARVPKLAFLAVGAALVIIGHMMFTAEIDSVFYPH